MSDRLQIYHKETPIYQIVYQDSFSSLLEECRFLSISQRKVGIITDSKVDSLYGDEVCSVFQGTALAVKKFVFPMGEEHKNLEIVQQIYAFLIQNHFDRKDLLIALGGGVTGDITGFCAATYLRGIDFLQIPTTLLSQVDSSIGGKTGVDFSCYKNMVGAFYQPKLVYMNLSVLKTLDERQFFSGMAEIIKHGLIKSKEYFVWLREHRAQISDKSDSDFFLMAKKMISVSCQIKGGVVERDQKEQGERALLNFGHTLGHAIEKQMNFTLTHGECVSLGIASSSYISFQRGWITEEDFTLILDVLRSYQLPVSFSSWLKETSLTVSPDILEQMSVPKIIEATKSDKKMEAGKIKFILLQEIGHAVIDTSVTEEEMQKALAYIGIRP